MALITLTTDFGTQDYMVGAVKGQILTANPQSTIIDITHTLNPFNYPQAAYICKNNLRNFPEGTFHIVLVDLFDRNPEFMLLVHHHGQYIGLADNGLIKMILDESPVEKVALSLKNRGQKNTITCVKVFAEAIREIESGKPLSEIGDTQIEIAEKNSLRPIITSNSIEGQILFIDRFENVVINITREEFEENRKGRSFKIHCTRGEPIEKISETYGDVPMSDKLALFNTAGYLEIAVNKGNAAGLFGLERYKDPGPDDSKNRILYQTVRIFFE